MLEIEQKIKAVFEETNGALLNLNGLAAQCGVNRRNMEEFESLVESLVQRGDLIKHGSRRYGLAEPGDYVEGRFKQQRNGDGMVIVTDESIPDIFIPSACRGGAFLNDWVRVKVRKSKESEKTTYQNHEVRGTIVSVLNRAFAEVVGTYSQEKNKDACIPDDPRFPSLVWILSRKAKLDPALGDKIVVQIEDYGNGSQPPSGKLVSVLGPPDGKGVDIAGIIRQYSLPGKFPKKVLLESQELPEFLTKKDFQGRVDCTKDMVITIDPDDARDFDDAISVKRVTNGNFKVWIHIADVSHFVKPGSELDIEAKERGNSTYLVDRVIPMLPESLSNGLCSLQPNVDRLTKCVEVDIDPNGVVVGYKLYSAVIHSRRRYTYEEAYDVLQGKAQSDTDRMIQLGWQIAEKLRNHRIQKGALDLDFPDRKIRLDASGNVKSVDLMHNDESHQLIEEFMLLANECVAKELRKTNVPSIFRIHEDPAKERLRELELQMRKSQIHVSGLHRPGQLNRLISKIKSHRAASALSVSVLRSMKRAKYSTKPWGHFGLAKKDYTHFTSPIRRYADLIVHRCLFEKIKVDALSMSRIADHISTTERNSADAEYDSRIVKLQRYLEVMKNDPVRGRFNALVTEVRSKGLMVDLPELGISGLVPIRTLGTDSFRFSQANSTISGKRTGITYRIGSPLLVSVLKIDKANRFFDFALAPTSHRGNPTSSPTGTRSFATHKSRTAETVSTRKTGKTPKSSTSHTKKKPGISISTSRTGTSSQSAGSRQNKAAAPIPVVRSESKSSASRSQSRTTRNSISQSASQSSFRPKSKSSSRPKTGSKSK